MKTVYLLLMAIFFVNCTNEENLNTLRFKKTEKNFEDVFELKETVHIKSNYTTNVKLYGIDKLIELDDSTIIISDNAGNSIIKLKTSGDYKIIAKAGRGPGEFEYLSDFIVTQDNKIIGIDYNSFMNIYEINGKFLKKIEMAYEHRLPELISECPDGKLIVAAEKNLVDKSSKDSYKFIEFSKKCYLNLYNNKFKLVKSFLNPDKKFDVTMSHFLRTQQKTFTPFTLIENIIIAMLQDGLYNVYLYNCEGILLKKYKVISDAFTEFDFNLISGHKVVNGRSNFTIKQKGEICASHSSPVMLHSVGNYILVTIIEPYDNIFPQFSNGEMNFHIDIFKYENGELIPVISNINSEKKIIGVSNSNTIFMKDRRLDERINEFKIYKYKMKI